MYKSNVGLAVRVAIVLTMFQLERGLGGRD